MTDKLVAKMVYLPADEVKRLEQEAREAGHSGLSQYVRWILAERRRTQMLGA